VKKKEMRAHGADRRFCGRPPVGTEDRLIDMLDSEQFCTEIMNRCPHVTRREVKMQIERFIETNSPRGHFDDAVLMGQVNRIMNTIAHDLHEPMHNPHSVISLFSDRPANNNGRRTRFQSHQVRDHIAQSSSEVVFSHGTGTIDEIGHGNSMGYPGGSKCRYEPGPYGSQYNMDLVTAEPLKDPRVHLYMPPQIPAYSSYNTRFKPPPRAPAVVSGRLTTDWLSTFHV
jgi:hypothetical protein